MASIHYTSLSAAFLMGLLGNVHCLGMCGGIMGLFTSMHGNTPETRKPYFSILLVNIARILSYTALGAIFGGVGYLIQIQFGSTVGYVLRIITSLFMIALGLYLMRKWMGLVYIEKIGAKLWQILSPITQRLLPADSYWKIFAFGALWGLMPCGLIYSALVWTVSTQSAYLGAGIMLFFGIGTLPGLLLTGTLGISILQALRKPSVALIAGICVVSFGFWNLTINLSTPIVNLYGQYCSTLS